MLKTANIFSPTGQMNQQQFPVGSIGGPQIDPSVAQPNNQPQGGLDLSSAIQGMLNPRDEQFQNYAQLIQSMPQRSQYEPDMLHKIGGFLAGIGSGGPVGISNGAVLGYQSNIPAGLKAQSAIKDEKYNEALNDWANKLEPTGKISQMEQNRNVGNRATALGELSRQQSQEKIDALAKQNETKNEQNQQNIDIRRAREESYVKAKQFGLDHPKYDKFVDENGSLVFINPLDPTATPIDSGVKKLSEMEKIDLGVQGDLKKIAARSSSSQQLEGAKQANRKEMENTRQINRLGLKETPSGNVTSASGTKPLTPSAQRTDRQNKAIDIISQRPELAKYFVYGTNKIPTGELLTPQDSDPRDLEFINSQMKAGDIKLGSSGIIPPEVNPQLNVTQPQTRTLERPGTESPVLQSSRKKLEAGYVLITRDGGKTFSQIPASNVSKLKPELGWVVVK